jgi:glycosyltransferase involved in cell wall biosynthesis
VSQAVDAIELEVIVVDDGSTDRTAVIAADAGATVLPVTKPGESGNPGRARNRGAAVSRGDPIVFLDADCIVANDWLARILEAHARGATVVGGSLALPPGLSAMARCDYYCGWYLVHPRAPAGWVPHHPPPNLSVRREALMSTSGFSCEPPLAYTSEERLWQGQLLAAGHRIYFEPRAIAFHHNRPGFINLLRRHYRWGYSAIESKSRSRAARFAWLYDHPWALIVSSPILVLAHSAFILFCWCRAHVYEPVVMLPVVLAARIAYFGGMIVGALRWLMAGPAQQAPSRPGPRWW